jgi:threonine synthase
VLSKLLRDGVLDPDAPTVVFNTGDGLKTLDAVSAVAGPVATIPPTTEAFHALEPAR